MASVGSTGSAGHVQLRRVIDETRRLLVEEKMHAQQTRFDQKRRIDELVAENRVLEQAFAGADAQLAAMRSVRSKTYVAATTNEQLTAQIHEKNAEIAKYMAELEASKSTISDLKDRVSRASSDRETMAVKVLEIDSAHQRILVETDCNNLLYETLCSVMKDIAVSFKVVEMTVGGTFSSKVMTDWVDQLDGKLESRDIYRSVALIIKTICRSINAIRPNTLEADSEALRMLTAAHRWHESGDISGLEAIFHGESDAQSVSGSSDNESMCAEMAHPIFSDNTLDWETSFHDAAQLIKYFSGLFNSESEPRSHGTLFPEEPFPIPEHAGPSCILFYEMLNTLKSDIKRLLDQNQIDLNHTSFAVALNEARSSIGRDSIQSRRTSVVADSQIIEENKALRAENEALKRRLAEQGSESDSPPARVLSLAPLGQITRGDEWAQFFRTPFSPENSIGTEQDNGMIDDGNELNARIRGWVQSAGIGSSYTTDIASRGNSVAMVVNSLTPVAALADWSWVKEGVLDGSSEHVAAPVNPVQTDLPGGSLGSFTTVGVDPSNKLTIEGSSKGAGVAKGTGKRKSANPAGSATPRNTLRRVKSIAMASPIKGNNSRMSSLDSTSNGMLTHRQSSVGVGKRSVSRSASMTSVNKIGSTGDKKEASNPAPPRAVMKGGRKK